MSSLSDLLDDLTVEGELYDALEDGSVRCYACGHRCLIREGRRGICQVRFNRGGKLRVPWGYVAALQSDPIEKKPFFHVLPGSNALTFGMLGCDFHCGYCFPGDTVVITDLGPRTLGECFASCSNVEKRPDGEIGIPSHLSVIAASGKARKVKAVFKHPYRGPMTVIRPYYLPALQCTPDHRVFATTDISCPPELVKAKELTVDHYMAIPRRFSFSSMQTINTAEILAGHQVEYQTPWKLSAQEIDSIMAETERGKSSRELGLMFARDPSYIRHIRSKHRRGLIIRSRTGGGMAEENTIRFPNERRPGIPAPIFQSKADVVRAFIEAVVDGDGHRFENGKISVTTVSRELAYGIAWLVLKLGYLPSLYDASMPEEGTILGRRVRRSPHQFTVVWYQDSAVRRKAMTVDDFYLIPLRSIETTDFDGDVFNMEVEEEHTYLAGFFAVSNCQNWLTSQAMRDPASDAAASFVRRMTPEQMTAIAKRTDASVVVSSYNEPLITSEWAVGIFKKAREAGLTCAYVSNGNNTKEVMEYLRPYISAYKVDLKCMQDKNYRKLGGTLQNTLDGIKRARELGLWVEVVTLVIPGFNDSNEELWDAARFLAGVSVDIPWHVTAFHKDYKMTDPDNTDAKTLLRAAEIGKEAGLRYVYAGNLPGQVGEYEDTFCPACNYRVVRRSGYVIREYKLTSEGTCPKCRTKIEGVWPADPTTVGLNGIGMPLPVY